MILRLPSLLPSLAATCAVLALVCGFLWSIGIVTEDEAKTKWCPFARRAVLVRDTETKQLTGVVASGNRFVRSANNPRCIASACMAWRGRQTTEFSSRAEAAFRRDGRRLSPGPGDMDGYCGLAGAPQ